MELERAGRNKMVGDIRNMRNVVGQSQLGSRAFVGTARSRVPVLRASKARLKQLYSRFWLAWHHHRVQNRGKTGTGIEGSRNL
jgi:hypothetical protein